MIRVEWVSLGYCQRVRNPALVGRPPSFAFRRRCAEPARVMVPVRAARVATIPYCPPLERARAPPRPAFDPATEFLCGRPLSILCRLCVDRRLATVLSLGAFAAADRGGRCENDTDFTVLKTQARARRAYRFRRCWVGYWGRDNGPLAVALIRWAGLQAVHPSSARLIFLPVTVKSIVSARSS